MITLQARTVGATDGAATSRSLLLHGILGRGSNLRTLALRLAERAPGRSFVLADLRLHGQSQGFAPPHTVEACVSDLQRLSETLPPPPIDTVIGHSFGGKVALAFAAQQPALERLVLLDSAPGSRPRGQGSEQTLAVLRLLGSLPPSFADRRAFVELVEQRGHSRMLAEWLAMNLERRETGFALALDLEGIGSLLDSYLRLDAWTLLESLRCRVQLIVGGRSSVYDAAALDRARALSAASSGRVSLHILPDAGHWLHVEDLDGVLDAISG